MGFLTQLSLSQAARQQLDEPTGEDRSIGGFFSNLVGDVGEIGSGLFGLGKTLVGDAVDLVTPLGDNDYATDDIIQALPGAIAGDYSERYGGEGLDAVGQNLYENPLSYIMDIVDVATLGASAGRKLAGSADEAAQVARRVEGLGSADDVAEADLAILEDVDDMAPFDDTHLLNYVRQEQEARSLPMGHPEDAQYWDRKIAQEAQKIPPDTAPFDAGPWGPMEQGVWDADLGDPDQAVAAASSDEAIYDFSNRQLDVLGGRLRDPDSMAALEATQGFRESIGLDQPLSVTDPFYQEFVSPESMPLPGGGSITKEEWKRLPPEQQADLLRSFDSDQGPIPPDQVNPLSADEMPGSIEAHEERQFDRRFDEQVVNDFPNSNEAFHATRDIYPTRDGRGYYTENMRRHYQEIDDEQLLAEWDHAQEMQGLLGEDMPPYQYGSYEALGDEVERRGLRGPSEFYDEWEMAEPDLSEEYYPPEFVEPTTTELDPNTGRMPGPFSMETSVPFEPMGMDDFVPSSISEFWPPVADAGIQTLTPDELQRLLQFFRDLGYES